MSATVDIYTTPGAICGQVLCGEVLCGASSDAYTLPSTIVLMGDPYEARFRSDPRILGHGANTDASFVAERKIRVSGNIQSLDTASQVALLRAIRGAAAKDNRRLRVSLTEYINLARPKSGSLDHKPMTARRLSSLDLVWQASDPFWYSSTWAGTLLQVAGSGTLSVDTGTTPTREMPCVVVITPLGGAGLGAVTLQNTTDRNRSWTYSDNTNSALPLVVDGRNYGSVTRSGADQIANFSGIYFDLLPGVNSLQYAGAPAQIEIYWLARWI